MGKRLQELKEKHEKANITGGLTGHDISEIIQIAEFGNKQAIDEAFQAAMKEIHELIESNRVQTNQVEQSHNQKAIDNWNGQLHGLKASLQAVSNIRNKYI